MWIVCARVVCAISSVAVASNHSHTNRKNARSQCLGRVTLTLTREWGFICSGANLGSVVGAVKLNALPRSLSLHRPASPPNYRAPSPAYYLLVVPGGRQQSLYTAIYTVLL